QIVGFDQVSVPAGHHKAAIVSYSLSDVLGDAENNIQTAGHTNICDTVTGSCSFTVTARTGTVGLVAAILDHDLKGTASPADDTFTIIGWATRTGITVADGVDQAGQDLALIDVGNTTLASVDFGTPPSGLPNVAGIIGLDVGASGTLQLPLVM